MQLKDIENLSNLAKIELSSNKKEKFLIDLQSILNYVEEIKNAPTGVLTKGESEEYLLKNKTREDISAHESGKYTNQLITVAPATKDNFIKVRKVL